MQVISALRNWKFNVFPELVNEEPKKLTKWPTWQSVQTPESDTIQDIWLLSHNQSQTAVSAMRCYSLDLIFLSFARSQTCKDNIDLSKLLIRSVTIDSQLTPADIKSFQSRNSQFKHKLTQQESAYLCSLLGQNDDALLTLLTQSMSNVYLIIFSFLINQSLI